MAGDGQAGGWFVFSNPSPTPPASEAQEHFSHARHQHHRPPHPNPSRAQHRAPQATAKVVTRLSLEAPEPRTLGDMLKTRKWFPQKGKTSEHELTNASSLEDTGAGSVGQALGLQWEKLSHKSRPYSLPGTQGHHKSTGLALLVLLPCVTVHSRQSRLRPVNPGPAPSGPRAPLPGKAAAPHPTQPSKPTNPPPSPCFSGTSQEGVTPPLNSGVVSDPLILFPATHW